MCLERSERNDKKHENKKNNLSNSTLDGINIQEGLNLKTKWDFFEYRSRTHKTEFNINSVSYKLHGNGFFVFDKDLFLNWNFGYRNRWFGIEPWILGMTLKKNDSIYRDYYDGKILKRACEQALIEKEMFEKNGLYHYTIPIGETFIPQFPRDYDTLVIEQFGEKWTLPRNKIIDRFLRKSNRVYNYIYNSEDMYLLRFFWMVRKYI